MQTTEQGDNVHFLDSARERRKYIEIANNSEHWIQTKACFALEGIELTDDHAERAGRLIAGHINLEQGHEPLMRGYKNWPNFQ